MKLRNLFKRKKENTYEDEMRQKLVFAFEFGDHKYYKLDNKVNLPFSRFAIVMSLLERLSCGLDGSDMSKALDTIEKYLNKGIAHPNSASKIGAVVSILRERQQNVIHKDLMLNIVNAMTFRDDESVTGEISSTITKEKLEVFERLCDNEGAYNFFLSTNIERLNPLLQMSQTDFNELWRTSEARTKAYRKQMDFLLNEAHTGLPKS